MSQYEIIKFEEANNDISTNNLFSSKNWIKVLQKEYGFEFYYFVLFNGEKVLIPFAVVKNLKGSLVISLPFCDYICTNNITTDNYLLFINTLKDRFPQHAIVLKTTYNSTLSFGRVIRKAYYHTIDLTVNIKYSSAFLRGIKKANNNNLRIVHDNTLSGLSKFYELYGKTRIRKFNSIPQPFSFFKNIFEVFISNNLGDIIFVKHENIEIAAIITLKHNSTLYYKFGASDMKYLYLRPNNLIFDYLIRYAIAKSFVSIDLGLSGESETYIGLRRFKESMGGVRKDITYYRIDPENYDYSHEEMVTTILTKYTKSLVDSNTKFKTIEKISTLIYHNFA